MEARLVREELAKCWREEGVNHYQSCHALAEKYLDMIKTHRVSGAGKIPSDVGSLRAGAPSGMECRILMQHIHTLSSLFTTGHWL